MNTTTILPSLAVDVQLLITSLCQLHVSVEYNGTTYQCYTKPFNKEEESETVTLIVRGGQHFSHSMGTFHSKVANIKTMHVALCIQVRGQQDRK